MGSVISNPLPPIKDLDISRFWSKVAITANPNKCWNWVAYKKRNGYGNICFTVSPGKEIGVIATRLSYYLHNKIDPVGYAVLHTCDNPSCVNPKHLFIGSNKDNTHDMIKKGRMVHPKGSHHGNSLLTEEMVKDIRKKYLNGIKQNELQFIYKIDQSQISRIVNRKVWTHI